MFIPFDNIIPLLEIYHKEKNETRSMIYVMMFNNILLRLPKFRNNPNV